MTSSMKKVLTPKTIAQAIGPYSQGLLIGRTLFVSGQVGSDANGKLVSGGLAEEFKQALLNVGEILKAGGCDFSNVVKSTVLLADINDFNLFNDVYKQFFKGSFPARSTYQVAALPIGAHLEIEVIAVQGALTGI
ncbi:2-iminobutanoate/2-iminopropanoate deaminase isoform X2 [Petaurus breviceps papuanus]|uniref:2-iminobutanoate/2-iminopropanoate deaminase isoform X2 n=1 Tax=Petaurus breviceps papuanus TaxID=3040969 RepID=UPI0036D7E2C3